MTFKRFLFIRDKLKMSGYRFSQEEGFCFDAAMARKRVDGKTAQMIEEALCKAIKENGVGPC